jgi:hypothetical protein
VPLLEERLKRDRDVELKEGLTAMLDIARDRLRKIQAQQSTTQSVTIPSITSSTTSTSR